MIDDHIARRVAGNFAPFMAPFMASFMALVHGARFYTPREKPVLVTSSLVSQSARP